MISARYVNDTVTPSMICARCVNHTQLKMRKLRQTNGMYSTQNAIPMAFNQVFSVRLNCRSMIACAAFATVQLS